MPSFNSIPFSFINYAAHCTAWLSYGKRLWPKQWAAGYESTDCVLRRRRGGGWVGKFLQTFRLAYLFRNAANPRKQISKQGNIARGNSSLHYASNIPQEALRNLRRLEFWGINMNENSIQFTIACELDIINTISDCIYHVKFNVCLVTKPLGVFSSETEWLNASPLFLRMKYVD